MIQNVYPQGRNPRRAITRAGMRQSVCTPRHSSIPYSIQLNRTIITLVCGFQYRQLCAGNAALRSLCSRLAASSLLDNLVVRSADKARPLRALEGQPARSLADGKDPIAHMDGSLLLFLRALAAISEPSQRHRSYLTGSSLPYPAMSRRCMEGRMEGHAARGTGHWVRTLL
ncbi:hypothetical protein NDU88_011498 [Pleurodeles waltl]|uniref:Uncharacterized protein n=1 Tax=Pleurodeles waltl TaxID=8319 RepID=A0AAV7R056_PLEWA|nr:hypothetical protein NDU88_011498 [Pleurodeles waltl]